MAVLYSPMVGLYTHMSSYVQLSAPEYQHHRKVDLRRPLGTTDFDGMDARDKTGSYNSYRHFRGTHSSRHDSCDAREAAWPVGPCVDSIVPICQCQTVLRSGQGHRRIEAQMSNHGSSYVNQLSLHGSCACLACRPTSLAHIQCVGPAGSAVTGDDDRRYTKSPNFQGC